MTLDPVQVILTQPTDKLRIVLDILQLGATVMLGLVAVAQSRAAREQAIAAKTQADAASTQAAAAHASLKQSLRPRLVPSRWTPDQLGGQLVLQNVGQGSAYAVRWRFDREWHWTDGEEQLSNGDITLITVLTPLADRKYTLNIMRSTRKFLPLKSTHTTYLSSIPNLAQLCSFRNSERDNKVTEQRHSVRQRQWWNLASLGQDRISHY